MRTPKQSRPANPGRTAALSSRLAPRHERDRRLPSARPVGLASPQSAHSGEVAGTFEMRGVAGKQASRPRRHLCIQPTKETPAGP
jgi:hypothetical protein